MQYNDMLKNLDTIETDVDLPATEGQAWNDENNKWGLILNNIVFKEILSNFTKLKRLLNNLINKTKHIEDNKLSGNDYFDKN